MYLISTKIKKTGFLSSIYWKALPGAINKSVNRWQALTKQVIHLSLTKRSIYLSGLIKPLQTSFSILSRLHPPSSRELYNNHWTILELGRPTPLPVSSWNWNTSLALLRLKYSTKNVNALSDYLCTCMLVATIRSENMRK